MSVDISSPPPSWVGKLPSFNTQTIITFLAVPAAVSILAQFAMGSDPWVVLLCAFAVVSGLYAFHLLGAYSCGGWLALLYVGSSVIVALFAKTLLGQTLDSFLDAPTSTFEASAVGCIGMLAAVATARTINVGKPILQSTEDPDFLRFLSWACFALGSLVWLATHFKSGESDDSLNGLIAFGGLSLMAVIARTAYVSVRWGPGRLIDGPLALLLLVNSGLGFLDDGKAGVALSMVSYFITVLFFNGRWDRRQLIALAAGSVLFVGVLAPLINVYRAVGVGNVPVEKRWAFIEQGFKAITQPGGLEIAERIVDGQFIHGYYDYFGGSTGQLLVGRFATIQMVDPAIGAVDRHGPVGGWALAGSVERLIPSYFYPNKPTAAQAYYILVRLAIISPGGGGSPSLPLLGQAYAAYGMVGVVIVPFLTLFAFLIYLKKVGWSLRRNIYAIFFLCDHILFFSQGDLGHFAGAMIREFPEVILVFLSLGWFYRAARSQRIALRRT